MSNEKNEKQYTNPMMNVTPVSASAALEKKNGRPKKLCPPAPPSFPMSEYEQEIYDYFIGAYIEEYPDLTPTDRLYLPVLAAEYVKYLRTVTKEFQDNSILSAARQHPFTQMRGLLDLLSVTRKQRAKVPAKNENQEIIDAFSEGWKE